MAVQFDRAVRNQLACPQHGSNRIPHAIDNVVQTRFEQLNQLFTGVTARRRSAFGEVFAKLLFQYAVHPLELLLFAQLLTVVRGASTRDTAVLTRLGIQLALESSERRALLRNRSVPPSRRESLHLGPMYRATWLPLKYDDAWADGIRYAERARYRRCSKS